MKSLSKLIHILFSPITIMVLPHHHGKPYNFKLPSVGIVIIAVSWIAITAYVISVGKTTRQYNEVKERFDAYYSQLSELNTTVRSLKKSESQFKKLFKLKNKEEVLKSIDSSDTGSIDVEDMEALKQEIQNAEDSIGEIKDYLKEQRSVYFSTPLGSPVGMCNISSPYGWRSHPKTMQDEFHKGVDLASAPGTPVSATANGIVVFAGLHGGSGNLVVLEHGFGFCTYYAHNKKILVHVGQKVNRGEVISLVGSTGDSTGSHVHYEIWQNNKNINPMPYLTKNEISK